jgi:hypothetical protein
MLNRSAINRKAINTRRIATKERSRRRRGYGGPGGSQKKDKIWPLVFAFSAFFCGNRYSLAGFNGMCEFRASISYSADFYFFEGLTGLD